MNFVFAAELCPLLFSPSLLLCRRLFLRRHVLQTTRSVILSDTLGTRKTCHYKRLVIINKALLLYEGRFGTSEKCHYKRPVIITERVCTEPCRRRPRQVHPPPPSASGPSVAKWNLSVSAAPRAKRRNNISATKGDAPLAACKVAANRAIPIFSTEAIMF